MKRFILPLLAALALPTAVNANVDPAIHNLCKDVSDYMGCVKANKRKEISIYDGLSRKEVKFLKKNLNSDYVSTFQGKWVKIHLNREAYVDINSIKRVGKLVSIKRCNLLGSLKKELCNKPKNSVVGGTKIRLFNCKKRLWFRNEFKLAGYPSLYEPAEWKPIEKSKFNLSTAKIACKN